MSTRPWCSSMTRRHAILTFAPLALGGLWLAVLGGLWAAAFTVAAAKRNAQPRPENGMPEAVSVS